MTGKDGFATATARTSLAVTVRRFPDRRLQNYFQVRAELLLMRSLIRQATGGDWSLLDVCLSGGKR